MACVHSVNIELFFTGIVCIDCQVLGLERLWCLQWSQGLCLEVWQGSCWQGLSGSSAAVVGWHLLDPAVVMYPKQCPGQSGRLVGMANCRLPLSHHSNSQMSASCGLCLLHQAMQTYLAMQLAATFCRASEQQLLRWLVCECIIASCFASASKSSGPPLISCLVKSAKCNVKVRP